MKLKTLTLALLSCLSISVHAEKKPNLIVILADDLGYRDVGFNGSRDIKTPHIDTIAKNGVTCSAAYVTYSVCGPSRAGLITGRYQGKFGFGRNPRYAPQNPSVGLNVKEKTVATLLKKVGYHTGVIGKWHLGAHDVFHPLNRGFDEFYGMLGGGKRYFPEDLTIANDKLAKSEEQSYRSLINRGRKPEKTEKYLTEEFTEEAVDFINRNKDKPFFLYLSYNAPHGPLQSPKKYMDRFPNITAKKRKIYAGMVSCLDDGVGEVLEALRKNNIEENTIVVFLSDNGGPEHSNGSNNGNLREGKSSVYEGGIRVPFAIQWKGKLPAGKTYGKPISSLDIAATIVELAKAPQNEGRPLDGENLIPFLKGEKKDARPHAFIPMRKYDQRRYAIRHGVYKLVIINKNDEEKVELYNVYKDIGEKKDIAAENPDIVERIQKYRTNWEKKLIKPKFAGLMINLDGTPRKKKAEKGGSKKPSKEAAEK